MTLDLYLARRFLVNFLLLTGAFMVLQVLIDLIDELQDYDDQPFGNVLRLVLLKLPGTIYELLPLIMILAGIAVFFRLSRTQEIVIVRAAGQSVLRSIAGILLTSLLLSALMIAVLNPLAAQSSKMSNDLANLYKGRDPNILTVSSDGLWLRQSVNNQQMVIHADGASSDGGVLHNVTVLVYGINGRLTQRIQAKLAVLTLQGWHLSGGKIWRFPGVVNPEESAQIFTTKILPTDLTRESILDSFGKPEYVSIWALPSFVKRLREAGFSGRSYAMWYQSELAKPFFLLSLVIVAASFCMRHLRITHAGLSTLSAILVGFGLYYVRNFAIILGENGQIPVLASAWIPPVASLLLAMGLLLHQEDG